MLETLVRHLDMVRLTIAAASLLMFTACSGLIDDGGNGGLSDEEIKARALFSEKAAPVIKAACAVCHDGTRANIGFAVGTTDLEIRKSLLEYEPQVVNLEAPGSSRLLTKGIHEGPQLDAVQTSDLLEWINAERDIAPPGGVVPTLETAQFLPRICSQGPADDPPGTNPDCPFNDIPLTEIGSDGSKIRFIVQALGSGLYVTNLKLVPGSTGAFIDHPLFVSYPIDGSTPKADTIDRFFNVKMNLMPNAAAEEQQIGGGTAAFVGFFATDKLSIHFKDVKVFVPEEGGGTVQAGCKMLPDFKANVVQPMNTNCASCHGGANANATSAMNITNITSTDDAVVLAACNEVLNRVNLVDPANSGIYLAPDPANANHPFKFGGNVTAYNAFKTSVDVWVQKEKTAP